MRCLMCSSEIPDDSIFCPDCGTRVAEVQPPPLPKADGQEPGEEPFRVPVTGRGLETNAKGTRIRLKWLWVLLVAGGLAIAALAWIAVSFFPSLLPFGISRKPSDGQQTDSAVTTALPTANMKPVVSTERPTSLPAGNPVSVYLFYNPDHDRSIEALDWLAQVTDDKPEVDLRIFKVWGYGHDETLEKMAEVNQVEEVVGVPIFFIGDGYSMGFNEDSMTFVRSAIEECIINGCPDAGMGVIN